VDLSLYHALNDFAYHHPWIGDIAKFFANDALFVVIALLVAGWLAPTWIVSEPLRRGIAAAGFSALLALGAVQVINHLYDRARPFAHHAHHLLISHGADASFPSDHASALFAVSFALLLRRRSTGWIALLIALMVSVARVMVGVHYPTDVAAGILIGGAAAAALYTPAARTRINSLSDALTGIRDRIAATITARTAQHRDPTRTPSRDS